MVSLKEALFRFSFPDQKVFSTPAVLPAETRNRVSDHQMVQTVSLASRPLRHFLRPSKPHPPRTWKGAAGKASGLARTAGLARTVGF